MDNINIIHVSDRHLKSELTAITGKNWKIIAVVPSEIEDGFVVAYKVIYQIS